MRNNRFVVVNQRRDLVVFLHLIIHQLRLRRRFPGQTLDNLPQLDPVILDEAPREVGDFGLQNVVVEPAFGVVVFLGEDLVL